MSSRAVIFLGATVRRSIFTILNSTTSSLSQTCQAHAQILKSGLLNDTSLSTKIVSFYANCESFTDATRILDTLPQPDLPSFSVLIYALSKFNLPTLVLRVFAEMLSRGVSPDSHVLPAVAKACALLGHSKIGKAVHGIVSVSGFALDEVVQSSLLHMYLKCDEIFLARKMFDQMCEPNLVTLSALVSGYARKGCSDEARGLFYEMSSLGLEPNLVSWNGMISGFNQSGLYREAVNMFRELHVQGLHPDESSISSALSALGDLENISLGSQIHGYVIKEGLISDKWVSSALIDMYSKCRYTADMLQVFDEVGCLETGSSSALIAGLSRNGLVDNALSMIKRIRKQGIELSVISWTSMIACCSQNGKDIEALDLFRDMQLKGVKPNSVTIPCLLPACGNIAALFHGKSVHCFSLRSGIIDVYVGSALVDMYAKCGKIRESRLCFDTIPNKNVVSWNAIISGYAMHGKCMEAMEMFDWMQKCGQIPDSITFTCVLSACSQKGLTDEGWYFFNSMCKEHGIEAKAEHYACMVNLLSRAGRLEEAYSIIKGMPFEPDACVWGSLLSSCRVHNNVRLAEIAADKLFELEPGNPGNYIILANMYASKEMWKEEAGVRNLMKEKGLKKNPGCSWIELKNKLHMLVAGDKSLPQVPQILEKLDVWNIEMKTLGLAPKTDFVLQDVEEQDKELILCGHSEKLAVAFGVINTLPGRPLRVIKNLRICGDCHTVMKFISNFEQREISIRDTNRFHHFKDGKCSCGDYWYSRSQSPRRDRSRSLSRPRSVSRSPSPEKHRSRSRSRSRSRGYGRDDEVRNPGNTLFVTGLSSRVTERDLKDHFGKEGKVSSVFLVVEPRTQISRGFAFVTMSSLEDADRCIKYLNQSVLEGRYITVEKSKRKRPRTPTPGNYLGLNKRESFRGDRGRSRGGYGRDDYEYRRSPRRSPPPYRGSRGYSPRRSSPYARSRRERSRSYSPYDSGYGRRSGAYGR